MMQRKGIPRSKSNASYFHGAFKPLLPSTQQDRKTVPGSSRLKDARLQRRANGNINVNLGLNHHHLPQQTHHPQHTHLPVKMRDGAIASISVSKLGKAVTVMAILIAVTIILKNVVSGSVATEELEVDTAVGSGGGLRNQYWQTLDEQKLPLAEYPSIQYALDHSDIVLLFFGASWCPMTTPITQLLDAKFEEILLPPENSGTKLTNRQRRPISLVYISSDESEAQMKKYAREHWITVPFHSEERAALKKHFKVCAKREMEILNMDRMYEIPTIVVVSGESHNVVTTHGADDLKEKGSEALIHWIKLLHTVKALEDKYY